MGSFLIIGSLLLVANVCRVEGVCQDLDNRACADMLARNDGLCSDPIGMQACPKFCLLCPVTCYHCPTVVTNYTDCQTVKTCDPGQRCFLAEAFYSETQQRSYKMSCVDPQQCSASGLLNIIGRRSDMNLKSHCCDEDRCNYPPNFTTKLSTTRPTTATTTTSSTITTTERTTTEMCTTTKVSTTSIPPKTTNVFPTCNRDIQFLIQDNSYQHITDKDRIRFFLTTFVQQVETGFSKNIVDIALMGDHTENLRIGHHLDLHDYLRMIKELHWHGHGNQIMAGDLNHFLTEHHRSDIQNGRENVTNVLIFIVDQNAHLTIGAHHPLPDLSPISHNVIVVNVGQSPSAGGFANLACPSSNIIGIPDYSNLVSTIPELLQRICT